MKSAMSILLSIMLCFFLLVIAPLRIDVAQTNANLSADLDNQASNFMDTVIDTGYLDHKDIEDFYLKMSGSGCVVDVKIERYVLVSSGKTDGTTYQSYVPSEKIEGRWNKGDKIKVSWNLVAYDKTTVVLQRLLHYSPREIKGSYVGRVRI